MIGEEKISENSTQIRIVIGSHSILTDIAR